MALTIFNGDSFDQLERDHLVTPYRAGVMLGINPQNLYHQVQKRKIKTHILEGKKFIRWGDALDWYEKRAEEPVIVRMPMVERKANNELLKKALAELMGIEYVPPVEEEKRPLVEELGGEEQEDDDAEDDDEA
jgi:hypothetical protein